MIEKDISWNKSIEKICSRELSLYFWYETEGHSGNMDCYPETAPDERILTVAYLHYRMI